MTMERVAEPDGAAPPPASASAPAVLAQTLARKRSRWEQEQDQGQGQADDADAIERETELARVRAAAKAARRRLKEARSAGKPGQEAAGPSTSASSSRTPPPQEEHARSSAAPQTPARPQAPPVPPRSAYPPIQGCRSVYAYERLNHIEEGSYGVVFRARERETGEIVAIKKLKMDQEKNGFPITSLREIRTLMEAGHPNVVQVKEIVVGDTLTQIFIVMEFVEHDLKTLLSHMRSPFLISEIKTLMQQLLSAVARLHANWIIHRDLKTSNLLLNNRGQLKIADFGLARKYGEPMEAGAMTTLVVTLWYRAPELLLGAVEYDTAVDLWSVGCVFAELMRQEPLWTAKNEAEQLTKIVRVLGQPTTDVWPGLSKLPGASSLHKYPAQPFSVLRHQLKQAQCSALGLDLLQQLLTYDPEKRITAQDALAHPWFKESPLPAHPDTFGSFPSVAAGEKRTRAASPSAPHRPAEQRGGYQLELDI